MENQKTLLEALRLLEKLFQDERRREAKRRLLPRILLKRVTLQIDSALEIVLTGCRKPNV